MPIEPTPAPATGEVAGPNELRDPFVRQELKRALTWAGVVVGLLILWHLSQPILLIIGGIVVAAMIDGGARLLRRVLPIGRGWRLTIVILAAIAFIGWVFYYAGSQLGAQFDTLRDVIAAQATRVSAWAEANGILTPGSTSEIGKQVVGQLGTVTSFLGSAVGAITNGFFILILGIFFAVEPRSYEKGLAWMFPLGVRDRLYHTLNDMGRTLRMLMAGRLLGMLVEGVGSGIALWAIGMPLAPLLGLLTGLLAFLPNIGSIISGALIVLVGLSAGGHMVFWAFGVYVFVQMIDGYLIVPTVARRTVDLAPALVLGMQIMFGAAFGFLGLLLADPIVAMIKVALEHRSAAQPGAAAAVATVAAPAPLTNPLVAQPLERG